MSKHRTIEIELGERRYPVHVGRALLSDTDTLEGALAGGEVLVVTDDNVAPLYLDTITRALSFREPGTLVLPAGEEHKTLASVATIIDRLVELGCRRDATIIALGGGAIGDVAGFAAACYMRGIGVVQVPTTLLAQVDASVGGKTGVNHPAGKNLIGAFHQPNAVVADTGTLATLPDREYRAGLAEVVKYGLIRDAGFFDWLEANADAFGQGNLDVLTTAIVRSVRNKAEVVAADEREDGERALLNLGHTFAHALETTTGYRRWLHGEAVAIGLVRAACLSARMGLCSTDVEVRTRSLLERLGLDTSIPDSLEPEELLEAMRLDKKAVAGGLRFVLLEDIGRSRVVPGVDEGDVLEVLADGEPTEG